MSSKATFPTSYFGLVEATSAALKQGLVIRPQRWNLLECLAHIKFQNLHVFSSMRSDGQPLPIVSQNAATAPTRNRLRRLSVWQTPLIADASTTICTRANFRAALLFPNLDCNLCPTLTAHLKPMPFSELAETRVQGSNPYLTRVLGWIWWLCVVFSRLICKPWITR